MDRAGKSVCQVVEASFENLRVTGSDSGMGQGIGIWPALDVVTTAMVEISQ